MEFSVATVTLKSVTPYSQSRQHGSPALKSEAKDAYEMRTWKEKAHVTDTNTLGIPAMSFLQSVMEGAKYSKRQIPGQGKATWTAKFKSGLMIVDQLIDTGIAMDDVNHVDVMCDAKGMTGSAVSTRVLRRFPQVPAWNAKFDVWVMDPIITPDVFEEMVNIAGLFIGIGRWRPAMNGGMNGRFQIADLKWQDNRKFAA